MRSALKKSVPPAHLTEPQIIAYLDGELSRPEQEAARAHLESCWNCRYRLNAVEDSVTNFLGARTAVLPEELASESRVEQFRHRLARHAAESAHSKPSPAAGFATWMERLRVGAGVLARHRQAVIACAVTVCIVIAMFTDALDTRVSADTVLRHAQDYDAAHLPITGNVTRTAIRVDHIDGRTRLSRQLGTITVLRDSATPEVYVSARSASGESKQEVLPDAAATINSDLMDFVLSDAALEQYLSRQRWIPDLSVTQFRHVIDGREDGEVSARKHDGQFELLYPFAPSHSSGITKALLLVDAHDYSLTSMRIVTGERGEYQFTRTYFSAEQRTPEIATLFSPAEISRNIRRSAPELPSPVKVTPLSYAASKATEAEVDASEGLHRVDACLGEEVYAYVMSDGTLLVQGLVDTPARRNAIEQSLHGVEGVRVQVFVPHDLKNGSELYNPPDHFTEAIPTPSAATPPATLADVSSPRTPLYDKLYQHFSKTGASSEETTKQIAVFSNELVTLARQTFLHAWALKRLDREFSPRRTSGLSASALEKVDSMRQDHRRWITTLAHQQASMLSDVAGSSVSAGLLGGSGSAVDSDTLLQLAQQQNDLIQSLLTTSHPASETDISLAHLLAVLRRMGA